jgi:hypothetical protein
MCINAIPDIRPQSFKLHEAAFFLSADFLFQPGGYELQQSQLFFGKRSQGIFKIVIYEH